MAVHILSASRWLGAARADSGWALRALIAEDNPASPSRIPGALGSSGLPAIGKPLPARILVVDDHQVLRDGIRSLLAGDPRWEICGEANDGQQAIDQVQDLHPDLIILDVTLPVKNGLVAAREIRRIAPSVKILIFSMHESPTMRAEFNRVGADAFVRKSAPSSDLVGAIVRLLQSSTAGHTH